MKEQDEIEQLFSSSFDGFEKTPPIDVKAAIDASLFSSGGAASETSTKRRKGIIWWFFIALLIGISGLAGFLVVSTRNESKKNTELVSSVDGIAQQKKADRKSYSKDKLTQNKRTKSKDSEREKSIYSSENSMNNANFEAFNSVENKSNKRIDNKKIKTNDSYLAGNIQTANRNEISLQNSDVFHEKQQKRINSIMNEDEPTNLQDNKRVLDSVPSQSASSIESKFAEKKALNIDSLEALETELLKKDSTNSNSSNPTDLKGSTLSPFSISIYGGTTYGSSSLKQPSTSNYKLRELPGFSASVEVNYAVNNRVGFGAGFDVNMRSENFFKEVVIQDSVFTEIEQQFVYDPIVTDSVIDTLYIAGYDPVSLTADYTQFLHHTSFALPLSFNWNIYSIGNWNYSLATVARLSFVNNKLVSNEHNLEIPQFKKFSMRLALRPQIMYSFDAIALGVYLNAGYDLIPTLQWTEIHRKRLDLGGGLFIRFQL